MRSQELAAYRPLPPQRWGFLPTSEFWHFAMLTPISLIFWAGWAVFFTLFDVFALAWWQQALAFMGFYSLWAGLVERYARRHLARRRARALASPRDESATVEAPTNEPAPLATSPAATALAPAQAPASRLALVQRAESWDLALAQRFGRGAAVASFAFNLAFGLAIFHPSWSVKLLAVLALLAAARGVGAWERRQSLSDTNATRSA